MVRKILHIDCNCFYAAVEAQRHPELRDKPLAVWKRGDGLLPRKEGVREKQLASQHDYEGSRFQ